MVERFGFYSKYRKAKPNGQTKRFSPPDITTSFRLYLLALLLNCYNLFGQCDSTYYSITATTNQQTLGGITISLSGPTNAQSIRSTYQLVLLC